MLSRVWFVEEVSFKLRAKLNFRGRVQREAAIFFRNVVLAKDFIEGGGIFERVGAVWKEPNERAKMLREDMCGQNSEDSQTSEWSHQV